MRPIQRRGGEKVVIEKDTDKAKAKEAKGKKEATETKKEKDSAQRRKWGMRREWGGGGSRGS